MSEASEQAKVLVDGIQSLKAENRDLQRQNEVYEIAVQDMIRKLSLARGEIDALEAHREHTRRWLRGELNYDPIDLSPHLCLWCGTMIEGGREGSKKHAVQCSENPVVQERDRIRKVLTEPLGHSECTISDLVTMIVGGDITGESACFAAEAVCAEIYEALHPKDTTNAAADIQPGQ